MPVSSRSCQARASTERMPLKPLPQLRSPLRAAQIPQHERPRYPDRLPRWHNRSPAVLVRRRSPGDDRLAGRACLRTSTQLPATKKQHHAPTSPRGRVSASLVGFGAFPATCGDRKPTNYICSFCTAAIHQQPWQLRTRLARKQGPSDLGAAALEFGEKLDAATSQFLGTLRRGRSGLTSANPQPCAQLFDFSLFKIFFHRPARVIINF